MRVGVIDEVYKLMGKNKDIFFLTGDLGYTAVEKIQEKYPGRFINVGVAEQNMIGIAAGLALTGKKVYVYSIIAFLILRAFEHIRDDLCYQDLDVTLIGIGSGLSYGYLSSTHFALEDIAIMRALPNMTIISPADEIEARSAVSHLVTYAHPTYIRIGKKNEPVVYTKKNTSFKLGVPTVLKKGTLDCIIFVTGSITIEVLKAHELLSHKNNLQCTVINISTIKPLILKSIEKKIVKAKCIITVEEHGQVGGLGSFIGEYLLQKKYHSDFYCINTGTEFIKTLGSQSYLRKKLGIDAVGIAQKILKFYKKV